MGGKRQQGRKPNRRPSEIVYVRIEPALHAALEAHVAAVRPATTKQAVVELALEQYLRSVGLWPPPATESPED